MFAWMAIASTHIRIMLEIVSQSISSLFQQFIVILFKCEVIAGVEQMRGRDGETADLQYFHQQDMPVLLMKYPLELLVDRELPHVHFDWNESYLNGLV